MIEQIFQLVGVELLISQKINDDAGVEVTASGSHQNATRRSEAHGSVNGFSVSQRTQTRSVAKVRKDGSLRKLCAEMMHQRFVGNTVKTVATNSSVEVALRKRQVGRDFGNRLMKCVVEAGKLLG